LAINWYKFTDLGGSEESVREMILTVGDSVCWGQGLKEEHKFDYLFAQAKAVQFTRVAHSGAVIGTSSDGSREVEAGEIPVGSPSLWQQVLAQADWSEVELVLLNGGINDVSLTRILNPGTSTSRLKQLVDQFCRQAMQDLLEHTAGRLTTPNAQIAVVGYYPILSSQSNQTETQFQSLLEIHGVATNSVIAKDEFSLNDLIPAVVDNCMTFWNSSDTSFQQAVDAANTKLGRTACIFVKLPFTQNNAMWAPQSLLWELTPFLLPEDEMSDSRGAICETLYGDVVHIPQWIQCVRASAGHPRVEGAMVIAEALGAVL
jgi:lysophospholipase L1-like esterase